MIELLLYTTAGCHLCEDAQKILESMDYPWTSVEISADDNLIERYGIRIPVIAVNGSEDNCELSWPFTPEGLKNWLEDITSR